MFSFISRRTRKNCRRHIVDIPRIIFSSLTKIWAKRAFSGGLLDDYHHGTEQQDDEHFYPGLYCLDAGFVYLHEVIYHFSALRWSGRNAPTYTIACTVKSPHQCSCPFSSLPSAFSISLTSILRSQRVCGFSSCQPLVVDFLLS